MRDALGELVLQQINIVAGNGKTGQVVSPETATAIHTLVDALYTLEPAQVEE